MDRLNQLRGETGGSRDLTLDTTSPPSEGFITANESSSKYFSLSEVDSTYDVSPTKNSVISTTTDAEQTIAGSDLISNLSPIPKKVDNYKIGKQIEAANILSGGVNIFDDNDNSYDGDELVIDDNATVEEEKSNSEVKNNAEIPEEKQESLDTVEPEVIPSKETEIVLQIDGKNVDAIDIGNGLYLYRKTGEEELAAVQIIDDEQQQQSFKFLKVRENVEGNLEVYEEIQIEVPKEVPTKEGKRIEKNYCVPIKETGKITSEPSCNKVSDDSIYEKQAKEDIDSMHFDSSIEIQTETKAEVNLNGKMMKFNESRKSPLIGTFTPMTYHSTPNKEGIPLTKTMVDQQLHPSRHSDNIKKTIEVHTMDNNFKQRSIEGLHKNKDFSEIPKSVEEHPHNVETPEKDPHLNKEKNEGLCVTKEVITDKDDDACQDNIVIIKTSNLAEDSKESKNYSNKNQTRDQQNRDSSESSQQLNQLDTLKSQDLQSLKSTQAEVFSRIKNDEGIDTNKITDIKSNKERNIENPNDSERSFSAKLVAVITESNTKTENCDKVHMNALATVVRDSSTSTACVKDNTLHNKCDTNVEIKIVSPIHKLDKDNKLPETTNIKSENITVSNNISDKINDMKPNIITGTASTIEIFKTMDNQNDSKFFFENRLLKDKKVLHENKANEEDKATNKVTLNELEENKVTYTTAINNVPSEEKGYPFKIHIRDTTENIAATKSEKEPHTDKDNNRPQKINPQSLIPVLKTKIEEQHSKIPDNKQVTMLPTYISNLKAEKSQIKNSDTKPNIIKNMAVPFGKWTEANRQEFLNKIKESKVPCSNSNTKQIKQPNDLNRRDVLKKIDSQRQSHQAIVKNQNFSVNKLNVKSETITAFTNNSITCHKTNVNNADITVDIDMSQKNKNIDIKKSQKDNNLSNTASEPKKSVTRVSTQRNQDLIDKTIEGIINKAVLARPPEEVKQLEVSSSISEKLQSKHFPVSLDEIEKKMNELHGIPFIERPPHELPQVYNHDNSVDKNKSCKNSKIPYLLPFNNKNQTKDIKSVNVDDLSEEEVIEHEPITGDIVRNNMQNVTNPIYIKEKMPTEEMIVLDEPKKEAIITENDFDKFARRNSITYENRLTVNFDSIEPHNVIQTVVEKEAPIKKLSRNEIMLAESKAKSTNKHAMHRSSNHSSKLTTPVKSSNEEESYNKNYQSKVQLAYQSALTAKRQMESPIAIIEDKPVKVVYMDSAIEFTPAILDVQGQELSPSKKHIVEYDTRSASDSIDSDILDAAFDSKSQDENKIKSKHQRKQVFTPVETPDLELIEPCDLGIDISPKKKRKIDKIEEKSKSLVPKKSYLLNRDTNDEKKDETHNLSDEIIKEPVKSNEAFGSTISAIDNLVKAAELIETQDATKSSLMGERPSGLPSNTPIKRGRGRPRKYPLPEIGTPVSKPPSPQKKPRLIDSKAINRTIESDYSSDDDIIKENWTMGKINENIVCPICNKLFRSENVVFKHVKHCTGPSPSRSDSDRRSSRRFRQSQDSERRSYDSTSDITDSEDEKLINTIKHSKTKDDKSKTVSHKDEVIVIEDTPKKAEVEQPKQESKLYESKKSVVKLQHKDNSLTCEICGKIFRQLSYLVSHKMQHKNEDLKKSEDKKEDKSVFSCEVCKKEFRKLHHLVQHRIIHNPNAMPSRLLRKSSNDQREPKLIKTKNEVKQNDDLSAGFRCEPCDKSFRKLHHLVEHRETHGGINKKYSLTTQSTNDSERPTIIHTCDFCKKTFKKLQHLLEHKEQHLETSSEKSDDKSVKSSLSTKDIIHECSLCYMVFPNEHSLNKHTIICLRKKKQSASKQTKQVIDKEKEKNIDLKEGDIRDEVVVIETVKENDNDKGEINDQKHKNVDNMDENKQIVENKHEDINSLVKTPVQIVKTPVKQIADCSLEIPCPKRAADTNETSLEKPDVGGEKPAKVKKIEVITIPDTPTPKKKIPTKEKLPSSVTKRQKSLNKEPTVVEKPPTESSDDDEIRYMFNPNFKESEEKHFMKVRENKRNSLQIERPNSKNLIQRRISLQHPSKAPRLKAKPIEKKPNKVDNAIKNVKPIAEATPPIDSDDSDVKYSFPENVENSKEVKKKIKKQPLVAKRKSISSLAKRKSLGTHKVINSTQTIRKRTMEAGHRCDCGAVFGSGALLARHASLAHTPPRRRRPSPAPAPAPLAAAHKQDLPNKNTRVPPKKSSVGDSDAKCSKTKVTSVSNAKILRSSVHKGVPVPEKMRKFMEKPKK